MVAVLLLIGVFLDWCRDCLVAQGRYKACYMAPWSFTICLGRPTWSRAKPRQSSTQTASIQTASTEYSCLQSAGNRAGDHSGQFVAVRLIDGRRRYNVLSKLAEG